VTGWKTDYHSLHMLGTNRSSNGRVADRYRSSAWQVLPMIVKLGHETVEVEATTREEAIKQARRALCMRLPRLWDVIMSKEDGDFECESLN